jgi:hypothetical protein
VKENAPERLCRGLGRAALDLVATGDCQAAEKKFGFSRRMLEVCLELGFPVSVLERSPLVLRDLDLLEEIDQRARAVMMWSIIYTPDSAHRATLRQLKRLAPPPGKRFAAMERFARAGILTGTCMMPVLPHLCDTDENLKAVVRWTVERADGRTWECSLLDFATAPISPAETIDFPSKRWYSMGRFVISAIARAFSAATLRWADGMAYRHCYTAQLQPADADIRVRVAIACGRVSGQWSLKFFSEVREKGVKSGPQGLHQVCD